jgi:hypothetical protein
MSSRDSFSPLAKVVSICEHQIPKFLTHTTSSSPLICPSCQLPVTDSGVEISGQFWHQHCVPCGLCRKPISLNDCHCQKTQIFHSHCFAILSKDRCAVCSDVILDHPIRAIGQVFHTDCLACARCSQSCDPSSYSAIHGFPYCPNCIFKLKNTFPVCIGCGTEILPSVVKASFFSRGRRYFVHSPTCLKCEVCRDFLTIETAKVLNGALCCQKCQNQMTQHICGVCGTSVVGVNCPKVHNWWFHPEHFTCSICGEELLNHTAVLVDGVLKCRFCSSEEREKCRGCGDDIGRDAVEGCGFMWHRRCLKCEFCQTVVTLIGFVNIECKPCCRGCYEKLKREGKIDRRNRQLAIEFRDEIQEN